MRHSFGLALFCVLAAALLSPHAASAVTAMERLTAEPMLEQAKFVCGRKNGSFSCDYEEGGIESGRGTILKQPESQSAPAQPAPDNGMAAGAPTEAAAPPPGGGCPKSSELIGGRCVHYTATCRPPVPAGVNPEICARDDEKLTCKTGADGSRSCCCLLYDKM